MSCSHSQKLQLAKIILVHPKGQIFLGSIRFWTFPILPLQYWLFYKFQYYSCFIIFVISIFVALNLFAYFILRFCAIVHGFFSLAIYWRRIEKKPWTNAKNNKNPFPVFEKFSNREDQNFIVRSRVSW